MGRLQEGLKLHCAKTHIPSVIKAAFMEGLKTKQPNTFERVICVGTEIARKKNCIQVYLETIGHAHDTYHHDQHFACIDKVLRWHSVHLQTGVVFENETFNTLIVSSECHVMYIHRFINVSLY